MDFSDAGEGPSPATAQWVSAVSRRFQYYLDKLAPHPPARWFAFLCVAMAYVVRVYLVQGFYIVSYGLGIYILNLLIGFLSPQTDPEIDGSDGPTLPTKGSDEFRPFIRRLPEFKFCSFYFAFCISFSYNFLKLAAPRRLGWSRPSSA
ncbi:hypothetical protein AMTRI_Chr13g88200 [Amborella trichopoda]